MTSYFPYSQIIATFQESVVTHPYFNGWSVSVPETEQPVAVAVEVATEIYY